MAEEVKVKQPKLPAGYVSLAVLRERWLQRQNAKKQEEMIKKDAKCEESCVEGEKNGGGLRNDGVDDCGKGKGKGKVVEEEEEEEEEVRSGGVEKRRGNVGRFGRKPRVYRNFSGRERNVGGKKGEVSRGFGDRKGNVGGGEVLEGLEGDRGRRVDVAEDGGGDRRRFGKAFGVGKGEDEVVKGNVEGGKMLEDLKGDGNRRINEAVDVGGDWRRFGKGLGVEKGNVVVGEMLEGSKGYGNRRIDEAVDVGGKFGGLRRKGRVKYGGDRRRFGKVSGVGKGENEVVKGNVGDSMMFEGSKGYGNRRINEGEDIGGKFGGLKMKGERKVSVKYGEGHRRFGKGSGVWKGENEVVKGNVVDVEVLEGSGERRVNEEVEIGGKFRGLLKNGETKGRVKSGRDRRGFGKVLGVGKGENVVENRNVVDVREEGEVVKGNVVDGREENVVDGKMLEVSKGYNYRRVSEAVDIGKKFGDLTINGGGREGKYRYSWDRRRFRPRKEKFFVAVRKENEVEKPNAAAVRGDIEVEKQNLLDVKEKNDVEPVAVRDENEVEKRNLADVKMSETSKGFGHRLGNEATGGKYGDLSYNGRRKGNVKYGRDRGMMWVKK